MGRIKRDRVENSGCISMPVALTTIHLATKESKVSLVSTRLGTIDRSREPFSGRNPTTQTYGPRIEMVTQNSSALQHSAHLSARFLLYRVCLIPDGFVRVRGCSSNTVGENTLNREFSEENPVSRGHSVSWDEVCPRFCVHTTSFFWYV